MALSSSSSTINADFPTTDVKEMAKSVIAINRTTHEKMSSEKTKVENAIQELEQKTIPSYMKDTVNALGIPVNKEDDYPSNTTQLAQKVVSLLLGDNSTFINKSLSTNADDLGIQNKIGWGNRAKVKAYILMMERYEKTLGEKQKRLNNISAYLSKIDTVSQILGSLSSSSIPVNKAPQLLELSSHVHKAQDEIVKFIAEKSSAKPTEAFALVESYVETLKKLISHENKSSNSSVHSTPASHASQHHQDSSASKGHIRRKSSGHKVKARLINFDEPDDSLDRPAVTTTSTTLFQASEPINIPVQAQTPAGNDNAANTSFNSPSAPPPFSPNTQATQLTGIARQPENAGTMQASYIVENDHFDAPPSVSEENPFLHQQSVTVQGSVNEESQRKESDPERSAFSFINGDDESNIESSESADVSTTLAPVSTTKVSSVASTNRGSSVFNFAGTESPSPSMFDPSPTPTTPNLFAPISAPTKDVTSPAAKLLNATLQRLAISKNNIDAMNNTELNDLIDLLHPVDSDLKFIDTTLDTYLNSESYQTLSESTQNSVREYVELFRLWKVLNFLINKRDRQHTLLLKAISSSNAPNLVSQLKIFLNSATMVDKEKTMSTLRAKFETSNAYAMLVTLSAESQNPAKSVLAKYRQFIDICAYGNITLPEKRANLTSPIAVNRLEQASVNTQSNVMSPTNTGIPSIVASPKPLSVTSQTPKKPQQTTYAHPMVIPDNFQSAPPPPTPTTKTTLLYVPYNSAIKTLNLCKIAIGIDAKKSIDKIAPTELKRMARDERKSNYLLNTIEIKQFLQKNFPKDSELTLEEKQELFNAVNTADLTSDALLQILTSRENEQRNNPILQIIYLFDLFDVDSIIELLESKQDEHSEELALTKAKEITRDLLCVDKLGIWYTTKQNKTKQAEDERRALEATQEHKEHEDFEKRSRNLQTPPRTSMGDDNVDPTSPIPPKSPLEALSQPIFGHNAVITPVKMTPIPLQVKKADPWYIRWFGKAKRFFQRCGYFLTCGLCCRTKEENTQTVSQNPPPSESMDGEFSVTFIGNNGQTIAVPATPTPGGNQSNLFKGSTATHVSQFVAAPSFTAAPKNTNIAGDNQSTQQSHRPSNRRSTVSTHFEVPPTIDYTTSKVGQKSIPIPHGAVVNFGSQGQIIVTTDNQKTAYKPRK